MRVDKSVIIGVLATAWSAIAAPARADVPAPADGRVTTVTIEGNRRIESDSILPSISLRRGDLITAGKVRRDLKAVYNTGFFEDVRVETVADGDGVKLIFVVHEKPAVRDVKISGNKKINDDDVNEVIDIHGFAVLNDADVKANAERIRDLYVGKGYYLAEVDPVISAVGDDQVDLTFDIKENRKVIVQRVEVLGNENVPTAKIKKYMQTKEGGIVPWLTSRGTFKQDNVDNDRYIIEEVYREEGYVDIKVGAPSVYLSPDKRFIYVQFQVTEGPKYDIGQITTEGDFVPEEGLTESAVMDIVRGRSVYDVQDEQWRTATARKPRLFGGGEHASTAIEAGEPFKMSSVRATMSAISDLYTDQGYAFVNVVPIPVTNPDTKLVDLAFVIDKGDKVRIGKINITGNDPTFDKVIRREILVNEGDIYRGSLVRASQTRLQRLGFFEKVDISTPRGAREDELDVNVQVKEQPTGSFSAGLGFSSMESLVLTFNMSKNNFFGLGYNAAFALNWSKLRKQFNISFADPHFLDTDWTFQFSAYSITRQYQLDEYQRGGTLGLGRYLDSRDDVQIQADYTFEDVGLTSLDPYRLRMLGGELFRNGLTSSIGLTFSVDKRNNRIFATKGFYFSAATKLAGGFRIDDTHMLDLLGGQFNFLETNLNFRFFQPLIGDDKLVFRVNSTAGWITSTDGGAIPYIHRYRAGGINSVRGYDWFSLGPTIRVLETEDPTHADNKLVVGGTSTWVNNFELEGPIIKQAGILGVVFFDAGNAFGDPWGEKAALNPLALRMSFGAGVRWRSPIGPLRFEYGIPINPDPDMRKSVFDFSIGSFF